MLEMGLWDQRVEAYSLSGMPLFTDGKTLVGTARVPLLQVKKLFLLFGRVCLWGGFRLSFYMVTTKVALGGGVVVYRNTFCCRTGCEGKITL